jgi:DNA-binding YbaB/EbfC family protein
MFKGISGLMQAMKQAQAVQGRIGEIQSKLADVRVEGAAGGGMVTVTADGQQRVLNCRIEPSLLSGGDREVLEELVVGAVNQALERAKEAATREMSSMMEGLDVSAMSDALSGLSRGDN